MTYDGCAVDEAQSFEKPKSPLRPLGLPATIPYVRAFTRQPRNGLDSSPDRLELQMSVVLVHVLARMASQLLTDLQRNVGVGHRRIEAVSERLVR